MRKYLVLLLAAAVVFMMAPAMVQAQAPASGKSVDFYAQVWWDAFYDKKDKDWDSSAVPFGGERLSEWSAVLDKNKGSKTTDHTFGLNPAVTRFGANFKNGNLTGRFEIRPVEANTGANTGSSLGGLLREAWAQYEFADLMGMKVLVGQTYTPTWVPVGMAAWGGQGQWMGDLRVVDREPMVQVQLPLGPEKSSLKVALVRPKQQGVNLANSSENGSSTAPGQFNYIENPFPKFEANYNLQINAGLVRVSATPVFGYSQEKLRVQDTATTNGYDKTVKSYLYGASATVNIGPGFVKAAGWGAKNGKEYGMDEALLGATFQTANKKLNETDGYGYHLVGGATVDIFTIYASYGYNHWERKDSAASIKFESYKSWISVGAKIQVLPSLLLMPEWARRDNGKLKATGAADTKRGKANYYGFETVIFL